MTPLACDELLAEVDEIIIADANHLLSALDLSDLFFENGNNGKGRNSPVTE